MSYTDLVNIDDFAKRDIFVESRGDITFYCKDCQKIVETNRPNNKGYTFVCEECKWKNVALWTLEWIKSNYRIK